MTTRTGMKESARFKTGITWIEVFKGDSFRHWFVDVIYGDHGQDSYDPECHKK
jgi:hypothetical protein